MKAGIGCRGAAVGDAKEIVVEERRGPFAVPSRVGFLVAAKLAHCLCLPDLHQGWGLGLHNNQGECR